MSDAIIVALITLCGTIISVAVTSKSTQTKVTNELKTQNEIQNQKIDQLSVDLANVKKELNDKIENNREISELKIDNLADEVRKHNNFAQRLPEVESSIKVIEERIKVANNRLTDLENQRKVN